MILSDDSYERKNIFYEKNLKQNKYDNCCIIIIALRIENLVS